MTMKHWIATAVDSLKASLGPIAHESNELDWKQNLSPKKDRLARHLSAFANHPNGGVIVFGLDEKTARPLGIEQAEAEAVVRQLANLGRDALNSGRIKRKDPTSSSSKFAEYVPYWA